MPTTTALVRPAPLASAREPLPPCPECSVEMVAVGGGRHRYWTCGWCGTTMPRR